MTRSYRLIAAGIVLLCAACVPTTPRTRGDIGRALRARVGHSVGDSFRERASLPKGVVLDDGLSADEAVALALWNNATLQATLSTLGFSTADLYQAGAIPNPIFSIFFPLGPKQLEMTARWSLGWLWQRPYRVAIAKLDVKRVAESLVASGLDTVRQTRDAFVEASLAEKRLRLLQQATVTWQRITRLAFARLNAGGASQLEATAIQSDARMAQVTAEQQAHTVRMTRAALDELLNLPEKVRSNAPRLVAPLSLTKLIQTKVPPVIALLKRARSGRPETRAAELSLQRAGKSAGLAVAQIFDVIGAVDANANGTQGFEAGPGADITLPIFNQNQAGRRRAQAEFEQATWRYVEVARRIEREVVTAYHRYHRAREAIAFWPENVVAPLERNVERSKKAQAAGGASYLVVLDTVRRLIAAQLQQLDLERELRLAWNALSRSVGGDLAHDAD